MTEKGIASEEMAKEVQKTALLGTNLVGCIAKTEAATDQVMVSKSPSGRRSVGHLGKPEIGCTSFFSNTYTTSSHAISSSFRNTHVKL
jgi:hypothetical protein